MPKRSRKVRPHQVAAKKWQRNRSRKRQEKNPFNRRVTKNLHNSVLGQRVNAKHGGHSITRSIEKRKETLLREYNAIESNKHNSFVDKRYEKTLENKLAKLKNQKRNYNKKHVQQMINKLTSQRLKTNTNKVSFNLENGNGNGNSESNQLTHLGKPISDTQFGDSHPHSAAYDEDDNQYLYRGFNKKNIYKMIKVKQMSFAQIVESAGVSMNRFENKTRPQIIKFKILQDRHRKCMQQIQRESVVDETEIIDHKFKQSSKDWLSFAHRSNHTNTNNTSKDTEYQQRIMELEDDKRSKVCDKTVTDARKAMQNYEILSTMEQQRGGNIDGESDWNQILEETANTYETDKEAQMESGQSSDDIDNVEIEAQYLQLNKSDAYDLEECINDIQIGMTAPETIAIQSNDWNILSLERECTDMIGHKLSNIPFTLDIPSNIDAFSELMCDKTPSQQITLLKRMRSTNHVKLDENNRFKIQRLYDMLLDHFRTLCLDYKPGIPSVNIQFYQYIDVITRALFALSHDIPQYAYSTHIKKLEIISLHIQKNYKQYNSASLLVHESEHSTKSYMPSAYALFYLKLVCSIFPKENKSNPLICSVLLILCKCITNIRINGTRDILCYLYCITLILEIVGKHKRYVPEVIHSIQNLLKAGFLDRIHKTSFHLLKETNDLYFTFCTASNIWNQLPDSNSNSNSNNMSLPIRYIFLKNNNESVLNTAQFKIQLLYTTLKLIMTCSQIWQSLLSYSEIFAPFYTFLSAESVKMRIASIDNAVLSELHNHLLQCLKEKTFIQSLTRKPLQLIHKRRAIPSLEPDFDSDLKPSFLRLKVRNETALHKKRKRILKKAIKKQQKAVMKEFQKDTQFIMNEKTKNKIEMENKRETKWKHEWHNLTEQQRDTNSFQMVGKKLKKKLMKQGVIRGF